MLKHIILFLLVFVSFFSLKAQKNTLNDQFNNITEKSNSYKEYKVVKKQRLNRLQKNVLDTVSTLHKKIDKSSVALIQQKSKIDSLNLELKTTKENLVISKEKEDGINAFGIMTQKATYNIIAASLIGILILIILILSQKYKSSFRIIKTTKQKLEETEEEYESFRQRSLEREQQLRRKLQDELNKNKTS